MNARGHPVFAEVDAEVALLAERDPGIEVRPIRRIDRRPIEIVLVQIMQKLVNIRSALQRLLEHERGNPIELNQPRVTQDLRVRRDLGSVEEILVRAGVEEQ